MIFFLFWFRKTSAERHGFSKDVAGKFNDNNGSLQEYLVKFLQESTQANIQLDTSVFARNYYFV